jgi:hypothetical protein
MRTVCTLAAFAMLCTIALAGFARAEDMLQEQRATFYSAKASGELFGEALDRAAISQLQAELHSVQLAAERYSIDNSDNLGEESDTYPFSVNQLVAPLWWPPQDRFINYIDPGFYPNPFISTEATERNAQCVPFGWNDAQSPGNFSYLSRYNKDTGKVDGYVILGYGLAHESGMDVDGDGALDGVVLVLYSSTLYGTPAGTSLSLFDNGREVTVRVGSSISL